MLFIFMKYISHTFAAKLKSTLKHIKWKQSFLNKVKVQVKELPACCWLASAAYLHLQKKVIVKLSLERYWITKEWCRFQNEVQRFGL